MKLDITKGGVTAAEGFSAAGTYCGIKADKSPDLALIFSPFPCTASAVFTSNKVKGAPILVSQKHLERGKPCAILANSGNANTCKRRRRYAECIAHGVCGGLRFGDRHQ